MRILMHSEINQLFSEFMAIEMSGFGPNVRRPLNANEWQLSTRLSRFGCGRAMAG
jgi:hypothetical protein